MDSVSDSDYKEVHRNCSSILSLNVCGLRSRLNCQEFVDYITQFDILLFVETKTDRQDHSYLTETFSKLNYSINISSRKYLSFQRSGGIAVAIKNNLMNRVEFLPTTSNCVTWFTLKPSLTGVYKELLIGTVYIPPEGTLYSSVDLFDDIESDIADLQRNGNRDVLLLGDFNAYTKTLTDFTDPNVFENDVVLGEQVWDYIEQCDMDSSKEFRMRVSQDKHKPNNYGYRLIELCKEFSLMILNGRVGTDANIGMCTSNGCTVVDYAIGSFSLFPMVQDFSVEPFDALLSDVHSPLVLTLSINGDVMNHFTPVESEISDFHPENLNAKATEKIRKWNTDKANEFQKKLAEHNIEDLNSMIDNGVSCSDVNKKTCSNSNRYC